MKKRGYNGKISMGNKYGNYRKNAFKAATTGRKQWKIENEGFTTQKNLRYDLEHANNKDWNALKNH